MCKNLVTVMQSSMGFALLGVPRYSILIPIPIAIVSILSVSDYQPGPEESSGPRNDSSASPPDPCSCQIMPSHLVPLDQMPPSKGSFYSCPVSVRLLQLTSAESCSGIVNPKL